MKHLAYVANLMRFAFRNNPLLHLSIFVSLVSAAIELVAMSSLLPLFQLVSGGPPSTKSLIARMISGLGFAVTAEALMWAFIVLFGLRIATQIAGQSLATYLGKRVMAQLCSGAFTQIVHKLSIREVNEKSIGFYISLAGDESFRASMLVLSLTQFVSVGALALLYFAAIAVYSKTAAGFVMIFLTSCLFAMLRVLKLSHNLGRRQTEGSRRAGTLFLDALNNIKTVRAFSAEQYVVNIHRSLIFGYAKVLFWVDEVSLLMKLIPVLLLLALCGLWLAWGGQHVQESGVAFVVTMIVYLMRFFPVVGQGVTLLMRVASDARTGRDVTEILELERPSSVASGGASLDRIEQVHLRDVSFAYDVEGSGTKAVLNEVNLRFERGRSYALVGKSGTGKSTLVDILLKFYRPTSGDVYLNGVALGDVADTEIRRRMILVSQEAAIFDDTVRNNIRMGIEADEPAVEAACRKACVHEVIETLEQGYNTRLQYRGGNLSGGQRQRIAIARALLRKPDVLILDEGTSALDKITQARVVDNILADYTDRIVILVTHDPQVMQRVDEVIDLEVLNVAVREVANAGTGQGRSGMGQRS